MKINTWNRLFVTIFGGYINFCRCSHSGYHYIGKSCTVVIWRIFWRIYWCWLCQVICTRDIVIVAWQRANLLKVRFCQKVLMFFWHLPNRRKFYFLELENLNISDWNLLRNWECRKIHIFWEGHKILLYLHRTFVYSISLWPSQNVWTLITMNSHIKCLQSFRKSFTYACWRMRAWL